MVEKRLTKIILGKAFAVLFILPAWLWAPQYMSAGEWSHKIERPAVSGWILFDLPSSVPNNTAQDLSISSDFSHAFTLPDAIIEELRQVVEFIGMDIEEAFARLGYPAEMYPLRGDERWQDDVVFRHDGGVSLFWFDNRVWQIRIDHLSGHHVFGLNRSQTENMLGTPSRKLDKSRNRHDDVHNNPVNEEETRQIQTEAWLYLLPDQGYPVRMLIYFYNNKIDDIYIYRGDF